MFLLYSEFKKICSYAFVVKIIKEIFVLLCHDFLRKLTYTVDKIT